MKWEKKLELWERDKIQPMTQPDVDRRYARKRLRFGRLLVSKLPVSNWKNKKVLETSIGSGGILCAFSEAGSETYGIDVNEYFIEISKQRFKDLGLTYREIRKWDGCKMPYPDNFFDFVISSDTLEHVPDYRNYIKEICRVLKPKGKTFVGTERRWFPYFIFWNPHSGLPLTILLPQPIRKFVEERIFGIPNLDYHWFSFFSEIKNEFVKHGVEMRRWKKIQDHCFNRKKRPEILRPIYNLMMLHGLGEKKIEGLC